MSKKNQHKPAEQTAETELETQDLPEVAETEINVKPEEMPTEEKKPDYYDQLVRLSADFDNYRKRTEREKASFLAYGKKQLAEKLLPSYEVLLRQQELLEKKEVEGTCAEELKNFQAGFRMIVTEMEKAFKSEGIERMDVLNKPYDPDTQEVMAMVPATAEQDGLVLQEVQMGFLLDGKVLRPARVLVGQHTEG